MQRFYSIHLRSAEVFIFLTILQYGYGASFSMVNLLRNQQQQYSHATVQQQAPRQTLYNRKIDLAAMTSNKNEPPVSLKVAAIPLLDAGKAFARTGELLIEMTTAMDLYGGALSSVGANIRNAGDNIAQAAASCRFKTATELVIDEIRESSSALLESSSKLQQAIVEANTDKNIALAKSIEQMIPHMNGCSTALEAAGASLLQRRPLSIFGKNLIVAGQEVSSLASLIPTLPNSDDNTVATTVANEAAQRCQYASEQMILAGSSLCPSESTSSVPTTGKSWLKSGI